MRLQSLLKQAVIGEPALFPERRGERTMPSTAGYNISRTRSRWTDEVQRS